MIKTLAEKLACLHMNLVKTWTDLMKDIVRYADEQQKKHKKVGTVKPVLSGHSKGRPKIGLQDQLSFNAGQKYCRMLQGEHSAIAFCNTFDLH